MTFIDVIVFALFVLFMVFVFGGYHKTKSGQREEQFRLDEEKKAKSDSSTESN